MTTRTDIINRLIVSKGHEKYLEIGVRKGHNFNNVHCPYKVGVDPDMSLLKPPHDNAVYVTQEMTSDEYFRLYHNKFDIIFIDGDHRYEQAYNDILNAIYHTNIGGCVVVHDTNPLLYLHQMVPRQTVVWNGDVWKAIADMRSKTSLHVFTVDTDHGVTIITTDENTLDPVPKFYDNWDEFQQNKQEVLNLISVEEFYAIY